MVVQYKCPNCGADMKFDAASGMLSCESCEKQLYLEEYNGDTEEEIQDFEEVFDETTYQVFSEQEVQEYVCQNCGAVVIAEQEMAATNCQFCGSPVVLADRLSGDLAPVWVIPFRITKEQAEQAFKKWCKKGILTPKGFMTADRIKNMTGIYIPFWLYDLNGRGEVKATCTKVRAYEDTNYRYTETTYFDVHRKVDLNYQKIPVDASEKMNDTMMDKLEPFYYNEIKEFKMPYLSGYLAEKYSYTDKELFSRVKQRVGPYVEQFMYSTIHGYAATIENQKSIEILQKKANYTLLPIWVVCYDYKQAEHNFYMNGQTGKIVGKPPLSKGKMAAWFAGISIASYAILAAIILLTL